MCALAHTSKTNPLYGCRATHCATLFTEQPTNFVCVCDVPIARNEPLDGVNEDLQAPFAVERPSLWVKSQ